MGGYLLKAAFSQGFDKIVCAASITEFGQNGEYRPLTSYAVTKQTFRDLAMYKDTDKIRVVTLVLSNTYGPGDLRPKVLNRVKEAIRTGEAFELSAGDQDYDAVYIDDVSMRLLWQEERCLMIGAGKMRAIRPFWSSPPRRRQ